MEIKEKSVEIELIALKKYANLKLFLIEVRGHGSRCT